MKIIFEQKSVNRKYRPSCRFSHGTAHMDLHNRRTGKDATKPHTLGLFGNGGNGNVLINGCKELALSFFKQKLYSSMINISLFIPTQIQIAWPTRHGGLHNNYIYPFLIVFWDLTTYFYSLFLSYQSTHGTCKNSLVIQTQDFWTI